MHQRECILGETCLQCAEHAWLRHSWRNLPMHRTRPMRHWSTVLLHIPMDSPSTGAMDRMRSIAKPQVAASGAEAPSEVGLHAHHEATSGSVINFVTAQFKVRGYIVSVSVCYGIITTGSRSCNSKFSIFPLHGKPYAPTILTCTALVYTLSVLPDTCVAD